MRFVKRLANYTKYVINRNNSPQAPYIEGRIEWELSRPKFEGKRQS